MPIDPDVQNKLNEITKKIDELAKGTTQGELVIPLRQIGPRLMTPQEENEFKKAITVAAKEKLKQFGLSLPQVAGTWGYSR